MRKKTTRELLKKIAAVPCLYRHEESGAYYGIKKVEGRILSHALKVESGQNITDRKVAERALRAWIDGLTEPKRYAKNLPRGERHAALSGDARVTSASRPMLPHPCANGSTISRKRIRRISISCWADSLPSGWLFRLSVSEHGSDFVLKGALLFLLWSDHLYRPTRDVDLLGYPVSVHQTFCRSVVRRSRSA